MRRPTIYRVSTALALPRVVVQTRLTNSLKRLTILFRDFVCFKALRRVAGRARALAHVLLDLRLALRYSYVGSARKYQLMWPGNLVMLLILALTRMPGQPG